MIMIHPVVSALPFQKDETQNKEAVAALPSEKVQEAAAKAIREQQQPARDAEQIFEKKL